MTVNETLGALGSWSLVLDDTTPDEVLRKLGYFGHIAILRGDVDVTQTTAAAVLAAARYVGVLREKPTNTRNLAGSGMLFWLGDEDNKGKVLETKVSFVAKSLTFCVTALLPPSVHVGAIHDPGGTYTGTHQWETPRQALDAVCAAFGVEYRVNGNGTIDVGTQAQLYAAVPDSILSARGSGADMDMQSIGTDFEPSTSAIDYTTRVALLGQTLDNATIVEATADAPSVPYLDLFGNTLAMTRMISDSGQTTGSVTAVAQLNLNRFNRTASTIRVTAEDYAVSGNFVVGDMSDVFDPDNGIFDTSRQLDFRGELIHPAVVRISAMTWSLTEGHTVVFRAQDGTLLDLTRWVVWETGSTDITVGDMPKTLTSGGNPVQDRANAVPDTSIPGPPTGLTLSTTSVLSTKGQSTATVSAMWVPPATNTDGTVVSDLAYYVVQYRWQGRAPQWDTRYVPDTTIDIPALSVGLIYDVRVAAVDLAGHVSAFTAVSSITAAPDTTAPNPPQDPTVTSYLGQLRIAWSGLDNVGGAMPADFAIVEVHVGTTSGFTPTTATLVSQLSAAGAAYATAPYSTTDNRWSKLVAVDNSGNRSSPSASVPGHTVQAGDGDIAALSVGKLTAGTMSADVVVGGRFATALTGGRVEMNSLGFEKFAADGVTKLVSITGSTALLTGIYKTALTGRRIEIGSGGALGQLSFYAPDGTNTNIQAYTSGGTEAIAISAPPGSGNNEVWNSVQLQANGLTFIDADTIDLSFDGTSGGTGSFRVSQATDKGTSSALPTLHDRLVIDKTELLYYGAAAGASARLWITAQDFHYYSPGGVERLSISGVTQAVTFNMAGREYAEIRASDNISRSAYMILVHPTAPYAASLAYVAASSDGATTPRLEVRDATNTVFLPVYASAFTVSSSQENKRRIRDSKVSSLDVIRSMRIRDFERVHPSDMSGKRPKGTGRTETGLVAEEAHPAVVIPADEAGGGPMVDLVAWMAHLTAAVQELDNRKGQAA